MIVERLKPSGAYRISTIRNGYLVQRIYYFYTRKEAIKCFREYLRSLFKPVPNAVGQ